MIRSPDYLFLCSVRMIECGKRKDQEGIAMTYRPVIGITPHRVQEKQQILLRETYINSIVRSGGLPIVLPCVQDEQMIDALLDTVDGLLLSGGCDIHPKHFGEEIHPACGEIDEIRDTSELLLVKRAIARDMPVFGICRGFQVICVALGATLFQDIESQLGIPREKHRQAEPFDDPVHTVRFKEGGLFERITQTQLMPANSMHHQAVKDAGDRIRIEGITMDGIVEAISMVGNEKVFGVEFHPEYLDHYSDFASRMFDYFIEQAGTYHESAK